MVQQWLYPFTCVLCGRAGAGQRDLCAGCTADLPRPSIACVRCAGPLAATAGPDPVCGSCLRNPPPYVRSLAALAYAPPVDHLVKELKFDGRLARARLLGSLLAEYLEGCGVQGCQRIVPVPLHPSRLRERGFNQALELARPVARRLGLPIDTRSCVRLRDTAAQSSLTHRQRRSNVRGAFAVQRRMAPERVAIVDDVVTTGHTAGELARALLRGGASEVEVWTLARAMPPR